MQADHNMQNRTLGRGFLAVTLLILLTVFTLPCLLFGIFTPFIFVSEYPAASDKFVWSVVGAFFLWLPISCAIFAKYLWDVGLHLKVALNRATKFSILAGGLILLSFMLFYLRA